ncbi:hypothetical protein AMR42_12535 [Limnothrix sp. PR1529]|nr:hypothetical protein BCR12_14765 [Limnothrix sp. P13C2]PIB09762.1 hypothetical protein AMR42_12535 [Limnothrix sp. PR1529]
MDHPIMADLKAARAKAWERLRLLVGQLAYYWQLAQNGGSNRDRDNQIKAVEKEAFELLALLEPNSEVEFGAYMPGEEFAGVVYVRMGMGRIEFGRESWVAAPMSSPFAQSIDDFEPDELLINGGDIDMLRALEG